jgi:hypothetical protein
MDGVFSLAIFASKGFRALISLAVRFSSVLMVTDASDSFSITATLDAI